jgi:hypothetical protein
LPLFAVDFILIFTVTAKRQPLRVAGRCPVVCGLTRVAGHGSDRHRVDDGCCR